MSAAHVGSSDAADVRTAPIDESDAVAFPTAGLVQRGPSSEPRTGSRISTRAPTALSAIERVPRRRAATSQTQSGLWPGDEDDGICEPEYLEMGFGVGGSPRRRSALPTSQTNDPLDGRIPNASKKTGAALHSYAPGPAVFAAAS